MKSLLLSLISVVVSVDVEKENERLQTDLANYDEGYWAKVCPPGYRRQNEHPDKCFKILPTNGSPLRMSFEQAANLCEAERGRLAEIESASDARLMHKSGIFHEMEDDFICLMLGGKPSRSFWR